MCFIKHSLFCEKRRRTPSQTHEAVNDIEPQAPSQSPRQASSDLQICPRCRAEGGPAGALFPLLPIPIINPLLPDESIRFPRPDAQRSTYMIDSIENAVFFPPLIYNGPISPLREFSALWRPHTVRWERGKCTFVMNSIICIKIGGTLEFQQRGDAEAAALLQL